MLTKAEKEKYADWLPLDFELAFTPLSPREIPESERQWLAEVRDYIHINGLFEDYVKRHPKSKLTRGEYELGLRAKFKP